MSRVLGTWAEKLMSQSIDIPAIIGTTVMEGAGIHHAVGFVPSQVFLNVRGGLRLYHERPEGQDEHDGSKGISTTVVLSTI